VVEAGLVAGQDLRKIAEKTVRQQQKVVEIDRPPALQGLLIASIRGRGQEIEVVFDGFPCPFRKDAFGLPAADAVDQIAGTQRLIGHANVSQCGAGGRFLIASIIDCEIRLIAQSRGILPQNANTQRVKCGDQRLVRAASAEQSGGPLLHFAGRLIGESDR